MSKYFDHAVLHSIKETISSWLHRLVHTQLYEYMGPTTLKLKIMPALKKLRINIVLR